MSIKSESERDGVFVSVREREREGKARMMLVSCDLYGKANQSTRTPLDDRNHGNQKNFLKHAWSNVQAFHKWILSIAFQNKKPFSTQLYRITVWDLSLSLRSRTATKTESDIFPSPLSSPFDATMMQKKDHAEMDKWFQIPHLVLFLSFRSTRITLCCDDHSFAPVKQKLQLHSC